MIRIIAGGCMAKLRFANGIQSVACRCPVKTTERLYPIQLTTTSQPHLRQSGLVISLGSVSVLHNERARALYRVRQWPAFAARTHPDACSPASSASPATQWPCWGWGRKSTTSVTKLRPSVASSL
ncbi:hypothetical protein HaLaN_01338 [Haematococcus lacustris]|uniref:Uncharacterized protein n=1 Tax=Haematococcus lacustris TaxID=44745 RepID=A0A699YL17_HAELA|nr:hypothetical protein HaLaN_01338 [Haematococcus lacustris]